MSATTASSAVRLPWMSETIASRMSSEDVNDTGVTIGVMGRDRWGMRRTFRTAPGRSAVSWRWEVGLPLFVMGMLTALLVAGTDGSDILFWSGATVAGVGAAFF